MTRGDNALSVLAQAAALASVGLMMVGCARRVAIPPALTEVAGPADAVYTNLEIIPAGAVAASGDLIAFASGRNQRGVLTYYDTNTHTATFVPDVLIRPDSIEVSDGMIAFLTTEDLIGQDVTSDGDLSDTILGTYDIAAGSATYTNVQTTSDLSISGHIIAFARYETDVNWDSTGDGDLKDFVIAYYDITKGVEVDTWVETQCSVSASESLIAFCTSNPDLIGAFTGDRNATEYLIGYLDIASRVVAYTNARTHLSSSLSISGNLIAFYDDEDFLGRDLNGDGDESDAIVGYYDLATRETVYTGAETVGRISVSDGRIAFPGRKEPMNKGQNVIEPILGYYDVPSRTVTYTDTLLGWSYSVSASNRLIAFSGSQANLGTDIPNPSVLGYLRLEDGSTVR